MKVLAGGMAFLVLAGFAQSLCMIAMVILILRTTSSELTGRVMGVRILAIYSLPLGLLAAGWLIGRIGFTGMVTVYALSGFALVAAIGMRFYADLMPAEAPANAV
jgi:hypothetical protein